MSLASRKPASWGTHNRRRKSHDAVHPGRSPRHLSQVRSDRWIDRSHTYHNVCDQFEAAERVDVVGQIEAGAEEF